MVINDFLIIVYYQFTTMKLVYRGIGYQSKKQKVKPQQLDFAKALPKYLVSNHRDANKIILVRPIHYYTYRGVSYTKMVVDTKTKLLLDTNRQ